MPMFDRFRKSQPEESQPPAPEPAPTEANAEDRPKITFSVNKAELAYWHTVTLLNAATAERVRNGQASDLSPELQAWFLANDGARANPPEEHGVMWYLAPEPGSAMLVPRAMLAVTGHDDPANQPGASLWAAGPEPSAEAAQRKARSMAALEQRQVKTVDHLPVLEDSQEAQLRSPVDVAERAVCLMAVALKAEVFNEGDVVEWHPVLEDIIATFSLAEVLSPAERDFAYDMAPDRNTAVQFIWRYESLTALLWALGHIDSLDYPSGICDVPSVVGIIKELGPHGLRFDANLRPIGEILDQADFLYRMHWAVRQAQLDGTSVPGVEAGVVVERRYALNWLLANRNEAWDDVSMHT